MPGSAGIGFWELRFPEMPRSFPKKTTSAGIGGRDRPPAKSVAVNGVLLKKSSTSAAVGGGQAQGTMRSATVGLGFPAKRRGSGVDRVKC